MGHQRRDGQDRRHEGVRPVRVCEREGAAFSHMLHVHARRLVNVRLQVQTLKTAIEAARVLLRVDDVVKATRKDREQGGGGSAPPPEEMMEG